ncbi:MAG: magnesium and cobalt transport protein CorA [Solirubrobacteraceae bacterium]|nr:magnesium and cobalt transport protein CorA [Solirubrobacteraceae bacterium]
MGEHWHGEIARAAFKDGLPLAPDSADQPDLRIYSVQRPSDLQIEEIGQELGLDPRALARARGKHVRARMDRFGESRFLILRPARYVDKTEEVHFGELQLIVAPGYVVLLGRCGVFPLKAFVDKLCARPELIQRGPAAVLHAAVMAVVEGYEPVIMGLEVDIDQIEDEVFRSEADPLRRIYQLLREVIAFQRATDPLAAMLTELVGRDDLPESEHRFVRDAEEKALHAADRAEGFRTLLENVLSVNLALETKRLSEVSIAQADQTKKISSWAAILFTPTLIGGIYGMNFRDMPELEWAYGYPFAIGLMVAMMLVLYVLFKRRDWI